MDRNKENIDSRNWARKEIHPTRAPRLKGAVKNARMNPVRKPKKK